MSYDPLNDPLVEARPPEAGVSPHGLGLRQTVIDRRFDGPVQKVGAWITVSQEALDDASIMIAAEQMLAAHLRRRLSPWEWPDKPAIAWTFDPFPRWKRLTRWVRHWNDRAARSVAARIDTYAARWKDPE